MEEFDRQAIVRVKQQLANLFTPNPFIYWADLLLSCTLGWGLFLIALAGHGIPLTLCSLLVSSYAFYRALAFTHELEHVPQGSLPGFRLVWHLLAGMPFCMPHYIYRGIHGIHHSTRYYGTKDDPEYVAFVAHGSMREALVLLALGLTLPLMVVLRYLVLSPLSLLSRPLRRWLTTRASAFVIRLDYTRQLPTGSEMRAWLWEEFSTSMFVWCVATLVYLGKLSWLLLWCWLFIFVVAMSANTLRALFATHRYASHGERLSFEDHIFDSINLQEASLWNWLVGPLGLRYHATHHVYPGLPYYNLAKAHRLLMLEVQDGRAPLAFYVASQWSTLPRAIRNLVQLTRDNRERPAEGREPPRPDILETSR